MARSQRLDSKAKNFVSGKDHRVARGPFLFLPLRPYACNQYRISSFTNIRELTVKLDHVGWLQCANTFRPSREIYFVEKRPCDPREVYEILVFTGEALAGSQQFAGGTAQSRRNSLHW
jgi:hypothetical protein